MTISGFLFCLIAVMTGLNTQVSRPPLGPGEKPRPHHTRAVTKTVGWVRPYYAWRNKKTILIFRGDENYQILNGLEEYHLDTGKRDSLDALNRRWLHNPLSKPLSLPEDNVSEQMRQDQRGGVARASVSPDGKWIVWLAGRPNVGAPFIWMTISLDGEHWTERGINPHSGVPDRVYSIAWLHKSPGWIGLLNDTDQAEGLIYDVYTQTERRIDFSSPAPLPRSVDEYRFWDLLAQRSNGHLLLMSLRQGYQSNNDVLFADIPPKRESGGVKQWTIHMPPNAYAREVTLSPTGDRLIWNLCFVPPDYNFSRPLEEAERKKVHSEIRFSKLDGSDIQRLGDLVYDTSPVGPDFLEGIRLLGLQWSPDGKHISYIYDKVLYLATVP